MKCNTETLHTAPVAERNNAVHRGKATLLGTLLVASTFTLGATLHEEIPTEIVQAAQRVGEQVEKSLEGAASALVGGLHHIGFVGDMHDSGYVHYLATHHTGEGLRQAQGQ